MGRPEVFYHGWEEMTRIGAKREPQVTEFHSLMSFPLGGHQTRKIERHIQEGRGHESNKTAASWRSERPFLAETQGF
jgi:hypothetical protein